MSDVAARLARVRERVASACARAGRDAGAVRLLAVSKFQPDELVREAYAAGQRDFGENYAQALRDRADALADLADIRWHAIGALQTNKVKYVARAASFFHAVDRVEVAAELSRRREGPPIDVFLEVNVAGEDSKQGVGVDGVEALLDAVRPLPNLRVVGLMAMPPQPDDFVPEMSRPHFRALRALADRLGLPELSMGTTEDFEVAIEEGATIVRVGRSIFGARK
jgi:pyridoxal phosphate enzyme (YggS family)